MNVQDLRDRPFCAGVLAIRNGRVLLSAYEESEWDVEVVPLGATAGGGQEPGETPEDCARREALEEIATTVELEHAATTYLELRPGEIDRGELGAPAPLLVRRYRRESAAPHRPGLPAGRDVFFVVYRARLHEEPQLVQIPALLDVPLAALPALRTGVRARQFDSLGITIVPGSRLSDASVVHVHPDGTEDLLARVVERFGVDAVAR